MRPEETRKHKEILLDFNIHISYHFCGLFGNLQNFVQLGVRLGVCQCRDTEAAHLEGPCRVGATWAHAIAKCDEVIQMTWRCNLLSLKKPRLIGGNLSIQEIGLGGVALAAFEM